MMPQIIKRLLLAGASFYGHYGHKSVNFNFNTLFSEAIKVHPKGLAIMSPGGLVWPDISLVAQLAQCSVP